jgi:hypothetical protein
MEQRRRRFALLFGVAALVATTAHRPTLDIHVNAGAPIETAASVQSAVKLGLMGVTVLVTWGAERLR